MNTHDTLQSGKINPNHAAPECPEPWDVVFGGSFFGKSNCPGAQAEKTLALTCGFLWGEEHWQLPAAYICDKGIVLDFCVQIAPERMNAFLAKWDFASMDESALTAELRRQITDENPLEIRFLPHLTANGITLSTGNRSSLSWIPPACLPHGQRNCREAAAILSHYGLDETQAWSFHRVSFGWTVAEKAEFLTMELRLERTPTELESIRFRSPAVGDVISFKNPVTKQPYALTVCAYEQQTVDFAPDHLKAYHVPTQLTKLEYTLCPEPAKDRLFVRDCRSNDELRLKDSGDPSENFSVIGGADGPTALVIAAPQGEEHCVACSALTFAPQTQVEWKIIFREKLMEDLTVCLSGTDIP